MKRTGTVPLNVPVIVRAVAKNGESAKRIRCWRQESARMGCEFSATLFGDPVGLA
jgi:hypothetical protein